MKKISLATDTIDRSDINALTAWLAQEPIPQLTKGQLTVQYEKEYAALACRSYGVFVNSGSSANLLAIYALIAGNKLKNKKVVVPALCWITSISPVIQFGLTPVICDVNLNDLSVDLKHLEEIFEKEKPACLFLVSILGLVPEMDAIAELCRKHDVILLMDNCESQSAKYKEREIESFGLMSTCSSYFGHITSCVEGGMILTDDEELYYLLNMLRSHGWSRDIDKSVETKLRMEWGISDFISRYTFYQTGFNVRNTEIGAFFGLRQLDKLSGFVFRRNNNYNRLNELVKNDYWKPKVTKHGYVSNLGYPLIHPNRKRITDALEKNNVEIRPLVSGSMGAQPFFIERYGRVDLPNATKVNNCGFYIPNHPGLTEEELKFMADIINANV